jgi:hypothetical protein
MAVNQRFPGALLQAADAAGKPTLGQASRGRGRQADYVGKSDDASSRTDGAASALLACRAFAACLPVFRLTCLRLAC